MFWQGFARTCQELPHLTNIVFHASDHVDPCSDPGAHVSEPVQGLKRGQLGPHDESEIGWMVQHEGAGCKQASESVRMLTESQRRRRRRGRTFWPISTCEWYQDSHARLDQTVESRLLTRANVLKNEWKRG